MSQEAIGPASLADFYVRLGTPFKAHRTALHSGYLCWSQQSSPSPSASSNFETKHILHFMIWVFISHSAFLNFIFVSWNISMRFLVAKMFSVIQIMESHQQRKFIFPLICIQLMSGKNRFERFTYNVHQILMNE